MRVDVSTYNTNTSISNKGFCAAEGMIVDDQKSWEVPVNLKVSRLTANGDNLGYLLVKLTKIVATSMKIKGIKLAGSND